MCPHDNEERAWISNYALNELHYATTQLGYDIQILEGWIYVEQKPIFRHFFQLLHTFKLQHSDFSQETNLSSVLDEINSVSHTWADARELTPDKLKYNPSLVAHYKLTANTILGKFAQRSDHENVIFCEDEYQLMKVYSDQNLEVKNASLVSDSVIQLSVKKRTDNSPTDRNSLSILNT